MLSKTLSIILFLSFSLAACAGSPAAPTAQATGPASATSGSVVASASPAPTATPTLRPGEQTLTVMSHDSFAASQDVISAFEQQNNVRVTFIKAGDAGAALNKAILSKNAPLADVFYGVDNTFLSRALQAGIYEPYQSPELANIPDPFKLDPTNHALPVDYADVCITYDKAFFASKNLPVPQTLEDLAKPEYKGMLVMENPATSSPGLSFLLTTVANFGADHYLDFWKQMRNNGLVVVDGWETAYYTNFSGSSGHGPQPMVVSYSSDPAAEVYFASQPLSESPVGVIHGPDTCFRQEEFVGILSGTQKMGLAEKWVDYMLSARFQEDMPLQMYVYPVNQNAKLPDVFVKFAQAPEKPVVMPPDEIAKNRDAWINAWTSTVLR